MEQPCKTNKPHVVCIPFPTPGHINPMLKLAKILHHTGFYITFVHTYHNQKRLLQSGGSNSLAGLSDFVFQTIKDGLPPATTTDVDDSNQNAISLAVSSSTNCLAPFLDLLRTLRASSDIPPPTCIISDGVIPFTREAAQQIGLPEVVFWSSSACSLLCCAHFKHLIQRGLIPLKDIRCLTNGYLETTVDSIPDLEGIRLKDFPTFIRTTDENDFWLNSAIETVERVKKASAIVFNTFEDLDHQFLVSLSSFFTPPIYTIGPLHLALDQIATKSKLTSNIGSKLWKEDLNCLQWLDLKKPNSVLYVNFGSLATMTPQQLLELAWGLANSKKDFLWIIRPDLVNEKSTILPQEFINQIKERGLITSWCPQEEVLKHPSIGGFLSHMGWNSTIESLTSGVPMICWPFGADQQTNCWLACNQWSIGIEIDSNMKREEVENVVRVLMEAEKWKEMKKKAMEWKRKAEEAVAPNGKSFLNFNRLVNQLFQ